MLRRHDTRFTLEALRLGAGQWALRRRFSSPGAHWIEPRRNAWQIQCETGVQCYLCVYVHPSIVTSLSHWLSSQRHSEGNETLLAWLRLLAKCASNRCVGDVDPTFTAVSVEVYTRWCPFSWQTVLILRTVHIRPRTPNVNICEHSRGQYCQCAIFSRSDWNLQKSLFLAGLVAKSLCKSVNTAKFLCFLKECISAPRF